MKITSKEIVGWLKTKLGEDPEDDNFHDSKIWIEHRFAHGDTFSGFVSDYTINYDELEREMNKWISATFEKNEPT